MNATKLYRIASVLLSLWAVGNTYGLLMSWRITGSMTPVRFPVGHSGFSYAQVVLGYEVFSSLCVLFAACLAWQLGTLARTVPRAIRGIGWILFAYSMAGVYVTWIYFSGFVLLLTVVITICIGWAILLTTGKLRVSVGTK